MATTKVKLSILSAVVIAGIATPVVIHHRAQQEMRDQAETTRLKIDQLQSENQSLSNRLLKATQQQELTQNELDELRKLRAKSAQWRDNSRQVAELKADAAQRKRGLLEAANSGLNTSKAWKLKRAEAQLARMKKSLHLSPEQEQEIRDIQIKEIERVNQMAAAAMAGQAPAANAREPHADEEQQILALLTPEQQAGYPEFKKAEGVLQARQSTDSKLAGMDGLNMTQEQHDRAYETLYAINLRREQQPAATDARGSAPTNPLAALAEAKARADQQLEEEMQALNTILSPEQLLAYQQQQAARTKSLTAAAEILKTIVSKPPSAAPTKVSP